MLAEGTEESSVRIEDLYTVVEAVCDVDVALARESDAFGTVEFALPLPLLAHRCDERELRRVKALPWASARSWATEPC